MEWLNINVSVLDSPEFMGSEPVDRATWLCLQRYCIGQENGGVVADCGSWGDRKWQQLCGITLEEIGRPSALWEWSGDDLAVFAYPIEMENAVKAKREGGKAGANARWHGLPISSANGSANAEGKEKKGKGTEGKDTPPRSISQKIETKALLTDLGLPNDNQAVAEWRAGLSKVAKCRSEGEAKAFIEWALRVCMQQGVVAAYWRHVRQLAVEWDAGQRNNNFQETT